MMRELTFWCGCQLSVPSLLLGPLHFDLVRREGLAGVVPFHFNVGALGYRAILFLDSDLPVPRCSVASLPSWPLERAGPAVSAIMNVRTSNAVIVLIPWVLPIFSGVDAVAMMSSRLSMIGDSAKESLLVRPQYHGNS